jgi:hypothetical protein
MNTYSVKALRATFTLTGSNAVFPGTSANVLQVTGLRMSMHMQAAGAAISTQASLRVYGMAQADMNALAVTSILNGTGTPGFINNTVLIEASSDGGQSWQAVFAGAIVQAGPDYSEPPAAYLSVQAQTGFFEAIAPALPTSFPVSTSVAQMVSVVAAKMGVPFINNGVNQTLPGGTYYPQPLLGQLKAICAAAHIAWVQDHAGITISPWGTPRAAAVPFILSPSSGLVGYPKVRGDGFVEVRSLYNPAFLLLGPITIQGSDTVIGSNTPTTYNSKADGNWQISTMSHALESQKPGGAWFTDMLLLPQNSPAAV